jgi:hypothetical protein
MRTRSGRLAAIGIALAVFGCGESRQEKFDKAMRAAAVARTSLDSARQELAATESAAEEARAEAADAEAELATASRKLDAATATYESARAEVAKWADDASVTRVLQQQLLDEPALEAAAVSARVEHGVALLEGSAPDEATRERAEAIARETPGVVDVQSQLVVASATAPPADELPADAAPLDAGEPVPAPEPERDAVP